MKLTDLGISARINEAGWVAQSSGTPPYMAPELRDSPHEHGPPADIYALAVCCFELFTGRRPMKESKNDEGKMVVTIDVSCFFERK